MKKSVIVAALAVAIMLAMAGCAQAQSADSSDSSASAVVNSSSSAASSAVTGALTSSDAVVIAAADVEALEEGAYLVDTRTADEFAEGHIPGALNASYPKEAGGSCAAENNAASFRANWAKLNIPKGAHVVVYCRTGVRAAAAASALVEDGYTNVELYEGSWADWTSDSSRPVETA